MKWGAKVWEFVRVFFINKSWKFRNVLFLLRYYYFELSPICLVTISCSRFYELPTRQCLIQFALKGEKSPGNKKKQMFTSYSEASSTFYPRHWIIILYTTPQQREQGEYQLNWGGKWSMRYRELKYFVIL